MSNEIFLHVEIVKIEARETKSKGERHNLIHFAERLRRLPSLGLLPLRQQDRVEKT